MAKSVRVDGGVAVGVAEEAEELWGQCRSADQNMVVTGHSVVVAIEAVSQLKRGNRKRISAVRQ